MLLRPLRRHKLLKSPTFFEGVLNRNVSFENYSYIQIFPKVRIFVAFTNNGPLATISNLLAISLFNLLFDFFLRNKKITNYFNYSKCTARHAFEDFELRFLEIIDLFGFSLEYFDGSIFQTAVKQLVLKSFRLSSNISEKTFHDVHCVCWNCNSHLRTLERYSSLKKPILI